MICHLDFEFCHYLMRQLFIKLIRRSEPYLKTDMLYVVKSGFWLSLGQVISVLTVFASAVVFGWFLPKEVYGSYKFILSAVSILGSLSLSGMGTVVVQATAEGKEGVLRRAVKTSLKWGTVVWLTALLVAAYYYYNGQSVLSLSILIAGACTPFINAYSLINSLFSGRKDFRRSTLYAVSIQIVTTLFLIITAFWLQDALVLVAVNFLASAILNSLLYFYAINKWRPNDVADPEMIRYGKHISFMNFFGTLANQLDKILVFHWLGATELALYAFAIAIPEQIKGSYKNLFNIALPKMSALAFSELSIEEEKRMLRKNVLDKFYRLTAITLVAVLAYWFVAPYIYLLFFPKYLDSVWYSQIYMLGLVAVPGIALFSSYFQVRKDTATLYKLNITGNVVTLILTALLIYFFGVTGAVIENGCSWFLMLLVNSYFFITR